MLLPGKRRECNLAGVARGYHGGGWRSIVLALGAETYSYTEQRTSEQRSPRMFQVHATGSRQSEAPNVTQKIPFRRIFGTLARHKKWTNVSFVVA
jgi:hypothetical protein